MPTCGADTENIKALTDLLLQTYPKSLKVIYSPPMSLPRRPRSVSQRAKLCSPLTLPPVRQLRKSTELRVFALFVTLAAFAGCSSETATTSRTGTDRIQPEYDSAGKLRKLDYDRNGDGTVDTWGYMDGTRVVRVESDENGDGTVDRWEFHRDRAAGGTRPPGPAAVDHSIERIERAVRFDGRVSRWEHFEDGVLVRVEEDTDGNGQVDKWETYTAGALTLLALDTKGRGKPDRRLVYGPDGTFDRLEADPNGTGTFERVNP